MLIVPIHLHYIIRTFPRILILHGTHVAIRPTLVLLFLADCNLFIGFEQADKEGVVNLVDSHAWSSDACQQITVVDWVIIVRRRLEDLWEVSPFISFLVWVNDTVNYNLKFLSDLVIGLLGCLAVLFSKIEANVERVADFSIPAQVNILFLKTLILELQPRKPAIQLYLTLFFDLLRLFLSLLVIHNIW